jgi:microcystin-dependent protein
MSTPFMAEIRIMGFNYAPQGWAECNGQLLPINQNQALFSLLGTSYGGNGQTNFALPDLRDRVPMHWGNSHNSLGEKAGQSSHTLTQSELPAHIHFVSASTATTTLDNPAGNVTGKSNPNNIYGPVGNLTALSPATITGVGGSQPHENKQPFLALNFCIALQGFFPTHS